MYPLGWNTNGFEGDWLFSFELGRTKGEGTRSSTTSSGILTHSVTFIVKFASNIVQFVTRELSNTT